MTKFSRIIGQPAIVIPYYILFFAILVHCDLHPNYPSYFLFNLPKRVALQNFRIVVQKESKRKDTYLTLTKLSAMPLKNPRGEKRYIEFDISKVYGRNIIALEFNIDHILLRENLIMK